MNEWDEKMKNKEKSLMKSLKNMINKTKTFADLRILGAYIVFESLADKVNCHNTF